MRLHAPLFVRGQLAALDDVPELFLGNLARRHVGRDHLLFGDVALEFDQLGAGSGSGIDEFDRLVEFALVVDADFGDHQRRMIGTDLSAGY